jgi:hypothetical protein
MLLPRFTLFLLFWAETKGARSSPRVLQYCSIGLTVGTWGVQNRVSLGTFVPTSVGGLSERPFMNATILLQVINGLSFFNILQEVVVLLLSCC